MAYVNRPDPNRKDQVTMGSLYQEEADNVTAARFETQCEGWNKEKEEIRAIEMMKRSKIMRAALLRKDLIFLNELLQKEVVNGALESNVTAS